jgi:DNA-binding response OmpR family regulator
VDDQGFMRQKVLIVEDDLELRALLSLHLRHEGFAVLTASNGLEALDQARSASPDLILLDLVLPELDGFAVCEALRRDRWLSRVPVIVLTGLTSEFSRYASLESGASEYVTKPASPKHLAARIRYWLSQPTPAPPLSPAKAAGRARTTRVGSRGSITTGSLVNTPLQRGGRAPWRRFNRLSGFPEGAIYREPGDR